MSERERSIRFYFDFISNNAYLAWTQIHSLAAKAGRQVEPVPVLFAGLLEANGQLGPAEIRPKVRWMVRNVLRKASNMGVALNPPASHPFNPLLALRAVSQPLEVDVRFALIDRLFRAVWQDGLEISDPKLVARLADEQGLDGTELVRTCSDTWTKDNLRKQTETAIRENVFGVPTMIVEGELFWGFDDFPQLARFLQGEDSIDSDVLARWDRVRPSAVRRRR